MIYVGTNLYAATGPKAKLFKVNVAGKKAEEIWSVKETHLLSLALSKESSSWGQLPRRASTRWIRAPKGDPPL